MSKKLDPIQKEIRRRNRLFKNKTAAQKRILIAKDVIEQIRAKRFTATEGIYIAIYNKNDEFFDGDESEKSAQKEILNNANRCECCAIGSVVASCILFNNEVDVESANNMGFGDRYSSGFPAQHPFKKSGLSKIFTVGQLMLMEAVFERHGVSDFCDNQNMSFDAAHNLLDRWERPKYNTPKKRLIGIMENIIENEGKFIP